MQIKFVGRDIELTQALKDIAMDKTEKLEKFFPEEAEMRLTFSARKNRHRCEITIFSHSTIFRSEASTECLYKSIDNSIQKMQRQLRKNKTALLNRRTKGIYANELESSNRQDSSEPTIERYKQFDPKPMSVDEAILQMQLTQHDFYAFKNVESDEFNVIYTRKNGGFGLLQPE